MASNWIHPHLDDPHTSDLSPLPKINWLPAHFPATASGAKICISHVPLRPVVLPGVKPYLGSPILRQPPFLDPEAARMWGIMTNKTQGGVMNSETF